VGYFLNLQNMSKPLVLHFVFDYTQDEKITDCKISRPWGPLTSSTATNPHWKFLNPKGMNIAPEMG
jgi:hypothetical protein